MAAELPISLGSRMTCRTAVIFFLPWSLCETQATCMYSSSLPPCSFPFRRESIINFLKETIAKKVFQSHSSSFSPHFKIASALLAGCFIQITLKGKKFEVSLTSKFSYQVVGALKPKPLPSWVPSESKKSQSWRESSLGRLNGVEGDTVHPQPGLKAAGRCWTGQHNGQMRPCEWTFIILAPVGLNSHNFGYSPEHLKVQICLQSSKF